jgi:hypothetical protein
MIQIVFGLLFALSAYAYVPTVESLFRNGANQEIETNGSAITLVIKKIETAPKSETSATNVSLLTGTRENDFYKIFFTKVSSDSVKLAQTRYRDSSFSEDSLQHKTYYPNFTPYTVKGEQADRGVFFGVLESLVLNNGAYLVNYLKTQGVPVKLNQDLINREKIEYLASYKRYLMALSKDRTKNNDPNPMRPEDAAAREKVEKVMNESMYVDTHQVRLSRENGEMAWLVTAGTFEAVISYKERQIQKVKFKTPQGDLEILCKDYWLANGTHSLPRYILVKDFKGETFQIEVTNLRHYLEKEDDLAKRLKKWDLILKGKESAEARPEFLL